MYCPHCGATLPDGSQFCGSCGKRLNVTATPAAMPAPKKKTPIMPILAGVLGAAIVIGAGVFAYQNFFAGIAINEENFPDKAVIKFVEKHLPMVVVAYAAAGIKREVAFKCRKVEQDVVGAASPAFLNLSDSGQVALFGQHVNEFHAVNHPVAGGNDSFPSRIHSHFRLSSNFSC